MLIDSHTHLYLPDFKEDIEAVMKRASDCGVQKFYLPAIDQSVIQDMLNLAAKYPGRCIPMMGLHPCSVTGNYKKELELMEDWILKRSFAAIGEIGLDFYWSREFEAQQYEAFHRQLEIALDRQLPVVLHSRDSLSESIGVIREHQKGNLQGIFHCFSGNYASGMEIIDLGFYLGIGGVITFKNSGMAETVAGLPLERMVLETDAPYLTPVPFRGKRNESSYIKYVAEKLAQIKGVSVDEVERITTANAQKIFGE